MNQVISPTVGRKVWYRPAKADALGPVPMSFAFGKPLDATIVAVHGDRMVNVQILDGNGRAFTKTSVTLKQDGDEMYKDQDGAEVGGYVEWPTIAKPTKAQKTQAISGAELEAEIQAKGLAGPRVTSDDLESNIVHSEIVKHVSPHGQVLRWAVLTTRNGFAVAGTPSCAVSPENDNVEIGERTAIQNAKAALWPLMGYELRSKLAAG